MRYKPGSHDAVHGRQDGCPVLAWYVAAPHGLHAVWVPVVSWYEPAAHARHDGVAVVVHVPLTYMPGPHDTVHGAQAVWPVDAWNVLGPHCAHAVWAVLPW